MWVNARSNLPNASADAFIEAKVTNIIPKEIMVVLKQGEEESAGYTLREYGVPYEDCQKLTYGQHDVSDMVDL